MPLPSHISDFDAAGFSDWLQRRGCETLSKGNEWVVLSYRKEEIDEHHPPGYSGSYLYGTIYRRKRGQLTFTGEAATDYLSFMKERKAP